MKRFVLRSPISKRRRAMEASKKRTAHAPCSQMIALEQFSPMTRKATTLNRIHHGLLQTGSSYISYGVFNCRTASSQILLTTANTFAMSIPARRACSVAGRSKTTPMTPSTASRRFLAATPTPPESNS